MQLCEAKIIYAMIEPSVVGLWKRDDEFAGTLVTCKDRHSALFQLRGIHERHELEEEIGLCFEKIRSFSLDRSLKFVCIVSGDAIPRFRLPPMHCTANMSVSRHCQLRIYLL